jgi:SET domain-containing protein
MSSHIRQASICMDFGSSESKSRLDTLDSLNGGRSHRFDPHAVRQTHPQREVRTPRKVT